MLSYVREGVRLYDGFFMFFPFRAAFSGGFPTSFQRVPSNVVGFFLRFVFRRASREMVIQRRVARLSFFQGEEGDRFHALFLKKRVVRTIVPRNACWMATRKGLGIRYLVCLPRVGGRVASRYFNRGVVSRVFAHCVARRNVVVAMRMFVDLFVSSLRLFCSGPFHGFRLLLLHGFGSFGRFPVVDNFV